VDASIVRLEDRPVVDVTFDITPGSRFTLREVTIAGVPAADVAILKRWPKAGPAGLQSDCFGSRHGKFKAYYE